MTRTSAAVGRPQPDLVLGDADHRPQPGRPVPAVGQQALAFGAPGREQVVDVAAHQLVGRVAEEGDDGGVDGQHPAVGVALQDCVG